MSAEGKLSDFADLDRVDHWSKQVYESFKTWTLPNSRAAWGTWEPGYLLLDLILVRDGEMSEPASIYSADEELTFATRVWHDHAPCWDFPETQVDAYVQGLAKRWFDGEFRIATYYLGDSWKGSLTIETGVDIRSALTEGLKWVRKNFDADRVELKGPFKTDDEIFAIDASGVRFHQ